MRLAKFLAFAGICSRRKASQLILEGKVEVNGRVIKDLSYQVDSEKDKVTLEGREVKAPSKVYYLFYKPRGYITSLSDPHNRETILGFLQKLPQVVFPVGRLDKDSEGLLLLTNDGDLANHLLHPRYQVKRTYLVWVDKIFPNSELKKILKLGIEVEGKRVRPLSFRLIKKIDGKGIYQVELNEGRKREVRRMVKSMSGRVLRLLRTQFGPLKLGKMQPGQILELKGRNLERLLRFVDQLKNSKSLSKTSSGEDT